MEKRLREEIPDSECLLTAFFATQIEGPLKKHGKGCEKKYQDQDFFSQPFLRLKLEDLSKTWTKGCVSKHPERRKEPRPVWRPVALELFDVQLAQSPVFHPTLRDAHGTPVVCRSLDLGILNAVRGIL